MELRSKIEEVTSHIEEMNRLLYQQKSSEGYAQLDHVLALLIQLINEVYQYQFEDNTVDGIKIDLNSILVKAMNAIESKDSIMLADIFQHELLEKLNLIKDYL